MYIITLVRKSSSGNWWMEIGKLLPIICLSDHWTIAYQCAIRNTLSNLHRISCIGSDVSNTAFYRYSGHIELIRFQVSWDVLGGMSTIRYTRSVFTRAFWANLSLSFPRNDCNGEKKDRCGVFGCKNDRLFPEKYTVKFSFCPESARKYWASAPWASHLINSIWPPYR